MEKFLSNLQITTYKEFSEQMIHKDTKEFNETRREIEELDPNDFDDRKIPPPYLK